MLDINRGLIVVKPKQPFLDWLHSLDPDDSELQLETLREDTNAYLIPEWETEEEQTEIFLQCAEFVFEEELWAWYTDEALWPTKRDAQTFLEWFDVEFHTMVFDVDDETPLEHVRYGDPKELEPLDPNSNGH